MSLVNSILQKDQIEFHDSPPIFNSAQRKASFYINNELREILDNEVRGQKNRAYFLLAYGYFKQTAQFYDSAHSQDISYVCNQLGLTNKLISNEYGRQAKKNHRELILQHFDFNSFERSGEEIGLIVARKSYRSRQTPYSCFRKIVIELKENKCEIPLYSEIEKLILKEYERYRNDLKATLSKNLTDEAKSQLDQLTKKNKGESTYGLTLAKRFSHSTKPMAVKKNLTEHDKLLKLYHHIEPAFKKLDMSTEGIKGFATVPEYQQAFTMERRIKEERHLYLVFFIANQLYRLQDILGRTIQQVMRTSFNDAEKKAKDKYYKNRLDRDQAISNLTEEAILASEQLEQIEIILEDQNLSSSDKVNKALSVIKKSGKKALELSTNISQISESAEMVSGTELFLQELKSKATNIENRCKGIVLNLTFDYESSEKNLVSAIQKFKEAKGEIDKTFPLHIIEKKYRKYVRKGSHFDATLYKVLFYYAVANALKCESLSLLNSYEFASLDSLLMDRKTFLKRIKQYLKEAGMSSYEDISRILKKLKLEMERQYSETNLRILNNQNSFAIVDGQGGYKVVNQRNTRLQDLEISKDIELYPKELAVSVSEALATVNSATNFLEQFQHIEHRYQKKRPEDKVFYAGIIGLGNHYGIPKIAQLSKNTINKNTLQTTVNTHFCIENIRNANDAIIEKTALMPVANLFHSPDNTHTSSDGQKYISKNESLNANFSFKYGGKDLVLSAYTSIDERNLFYHSTVFSGAEREAHYVIDSILSNNVVKSKIHSTDTHGYTEAVFGISHILGVSFAPHIKNFKKSKLYSFDSASKYKRKNYPVLPSGKIKTDIIEEQWNEILRLLVSIKLGFTTASSVFKRLNSYSKENPLYNAIKEFGRIPKTLHILRYIDDEEYRRAIRKQLNRGEAGNRLDRALAVGSPDYTEIEKDDQIMAESCKRLIKNVIVCWNYMYLSQRLIDAKDDFEKSILLDKILDSSTVTWRHFLIQGEYIFSDDRLSDSRNFKFNKMLNPSIVKVKYSKRKIIYNDS